MSSPRGDEIAGAEKPECKSAGKRPACEVELVTTNTPVAPPAPRPGADASANGTATAIGQDRRILVAVDDLFFLAKIQETARQLKVTIERAKTDKELLEKAATPPSLIILDLNSTALKPLTTIAKIRHNPQLKKTPMIGFLSHLQADLKLKAQDAGCDLVMPRSAFSVNLPSLLRRHGLPEG